MSRWHAHLAGLGAMLLACSAQAADVLIYRGRYTYLVPPVIAKLMLQLAPRDQWQQFPDLTRHVDEDGDGRDDFVAIALGARRGYGMQLRYRIRIGDDGKPYAGRWYWCIITDARGRKVFERFNP